MKFSSAQSWNAVSLRILRSAMREQSSFKSPLVLGVIYFAPPVPDEKKPNNPAIMEDDNNSRDG